MKISSFVTDIFASYSLVSDNLYDLTTIRHPADQLYSVAQSAKRRSEAEIR